MADSKSSSAKPGGSRTAAARQARESAAAKTAPGSDSTSKQVVTKVARVPLHDVDSNLIYEPGDQVDDADLDGLPVGSLTSVTQDTETGYQWAEGHHSVSVIPGTVSEKADAVRTPGGPDTDTIVGRDAAELAPDTLPQADQADGPGAPAAKGNEPPAQSAAAHPDAPAKDADKK
jgi:hypothetical protein